MAYPSQSTLSEESVHRGNTCSFKYCAVGDLIRPLNGQDAAKASHVEGVQTFTNVSPVQHKWSRTHSRKVRCSRYRHDRQQF